MIILLSPAKTIDPKESTHALEMTQPHFLDRAKYLVEKLKKFSPRQLGQLMNVSDSIAVLNHDRFQAFEMPFHKGNSHPAILSFQGEVYRGLDASSMGPEDFQFAQNHVRILSGMYGVLKPLDWMQAYRLEMGAKWAVTPSNKNLYTYWGDDIAAHLADVATGTVVNLASQEYSKAAFRPALGANIITPVFKDLVKGEYRSLMTYAKHARGSMTRFAIQNRITDPEQLQGFQGMGYRYNPNLSETNQWVFTR